MRIIKEKSSIIWIGIFFLIVIVIFLPFKIPYSINTPGKILPVKEWIVIKGPDGRLITQLKNNRFGTINNYSVSQFERGDAVQFTLKPNIVSGAYVAADDTVASIYSNEIERQYFQLKGELGVAIASLEMNKTGEKISVINEEKNQLEYRKKQVEEYKKQFDRIEVLFSKNMVSQEEYEIAKSKYELNEINIKISEAHLQSLITGSKPEQLNYIKAEISSLKNQVNILQKRFENYTLVSPLNGIVNQIYGDDTILVISDTTEYVIISPVKWEEKDFITLNQKLKVKIPDSRFEYDATVIRSENGVHLLNRKQVFLITSLLNNKSNDMIYGLMVQCSIKCNSISTLEYISRLLKVI